MRVAVPPCTRPSRAAIRGPHPGGEKGNGILADSRIKEEALASR